jgi:hypothetical protein
MMIGWREGGIELDSKGSVLFCAPAVLTALLAPRNAKMQLAATASHFLLRINVCVLNENRFRFPNAIVATPGACT